MSNWRLRRERRLALHKAKTLHNTATTLEKVATKHRQEGTASDHWIRGMEAAAGRVRFEADHEDYHAYLLGSLIENSNNVSRETTP